eukprot:721147-Karenia_brevis.AAC.1
MKSPIQQSSMPGQDMRMASTAAEHGVCHASVKTMPVKIFGWSHLLAFRLQQRTLVFVGQFGPVSYTHLTLPTICSV